MLILTRFNGESLIIGEEEVEVEVLRIDVEKRQVHLGIKAPKHVPVDRKEVFFKKKLLGQKNKHVSETKKEK